MRASSEAPTSPRERWLSTTWMVTISAVGNKFSLVAVPEPTSLHLSRVQVWRHTRALAHRADDLELLQRISSGLGRSKRLVEHRDIDAISDLRPVRDPQSQIEIVVENCTAQPRHGKNPFMR